MASGAGVLRLLLAASAGTMTHGGGERLCSSCGELKRTSLGLHNTHTVQTRLDAMVVTGVPSRTVGGAVAARPVCRGLWYPTGCVISKGPGRCQPGDCS